MSTSFFGCTANVKSSLDLDIKFKKRNPSQTIILNARFYIVGCPVRERRCHSTFSSSDENETPLNNPTGGRGIYHQIRVNYKEKFKNCLYVCPNPFINKHDIYVQVAYTSR
jgi:hypothetical protein